jgi:hypothetical protein
MFLVRQTMPKQCFGKVQCEYTKGRSIRTHKFTAFWEATRRTLAKSHFSSSGEPAVPISILKLETIPPKR